MELIAGIIVGLVVGGGALYAVLRSRAVRLETQLDERSRQLETTLRERDEARGEREARGGELAQATAEKALRSNDDQEQARRFEELSATGEARQIGEPAPVEQTVRRVDTPELPLATGDD